MDEIKRIKANLLIAELLGYTFKEVPEVDNTSGAASKTYWYKDGQHVTPVDFIQEIIDLDIGNHQWIRHNHQSIKRRLIPVDDWNTLVDVKLLNGSTLEMVKACNLDWVITANKGTITHWRLNKSEL